MTWNVHTRGTQETVKAAIVSDKSLEPNVKTFLAALVDALPPGTSALRLDSYCQDGENARQMRFTRNIQVTIEAVKV